VYELLTGKPPFYTGNVEHQVLNVTPKPMDQRLAEFGFTNEIPGYANQLVMACLAKEPEGRPQGMAAIREWIESEGAAKEVMPKPSTKTVKKLAEPAQAKRTNYALVAVALALVVGLGIWLKGQIEGLGSGQLPVQVSKFPTTNPEPVKPKPPVTQPVQPTNSATAGKERMLWQFETGDAVVSSPAIGSDGTVYVGSYDKKLYAINGKSGVKLWEFETGGGVQSSPAIGSDGTVYVGSYDKKLYAINGKSGVKLWEFETGGGVNSSPAIGSDGTVYVGSGDKKLYAINGKSGVKLWEFQTGDWVYSSPAIGSDGTVYVGSKDNKLYAINGKSGVKLWEFQTGGKVSSSPAIGSDGTVYVGSLDKKLYAIKTDSKSLAKSPWPMRGQNPQHTGHAPAK
jgi:hypothetical protein